MSRYHGESDLEQLRSLYEGDARIALLMKQLVEDLASIEPVPPMPKAKPERKGKVKKEVKPRLMLSQEHASKRGTIITSHLLAMPKGEVPSDDLDLKHVFNQHPFDDEKVREGWNIIHDRSLNSQYPDHDIYWLCSADWLSEAVVKAVVSAVLEAEKPAAPTVTTPVRKVTNEIVLG